ncbi:MAG: TetR/AcrR family transcriptional regulator [Labilithrix sp.]|nr:TetR/AcrR family transcriptional regulator [Labilithrix sp.]MCW5812283.1 TetR/AcrR family transcriptional regulator [Labilithrix sp.]
MALAKKRDDDVRGEILAAAVRTIEEGGLADLSMREVARRAGVSHQLPYHYFTDREGILAAIAQSGFTLLGARLRKLTTADMTGAEKLAAAGREYVEFACDHPAHFRVMFRNDFVAVERFPTAQENADDCFALLPKLVGEAIADGLPPKPDERALVILGWSIAHGLACLLLDGPLAKKLPDAAGARAATVHAVMEALKNLVEASSKPRRKRPRST